MKVTLRQQLSSIERADLSIRMVVGPDTKVLHIKAPGRRGTVRVSSLGQLVTTVSGV